MTVLDSFMAFAARLGEAERKSIEETLAEIMLNHETSTDFSPTERAELERRLADPVLASDDDVRKIFGNAFNT